MINIFEAKDESSDTLFKNSALDRGSCDRIIARSFIELLEKLEKSFDEDASRHWGSWEVSDMLHDLRIKLKYDKREIL